jgi:hypothetical protein
MVVSQAGHLRSEGTSGLKNGQHNFFFGVAAADLAGEAALTAAAAAGGVADKQEAASEAATDPDSE